MKWMLSCHEASQLVSEALDRELPWSKRLVLGIHLMMCKHCSRFSQQLELMRSILRKRKEGAYEDNLPSLSTEKKEELKKILSTEEPPSAS